MTDITIIKHYASLASFEADTTNRKLINTVPLSEVLDDILDEIDEKEV